MQETEFFYWLQGYFELRETEQLLTHAQCECIVRHCALVQATHLSPRLVEVRMMANMLLCGLDAEIITTNMQAKVAEQFAHVIDPAAGDDGDFDDVAAFEAVMES